MKFVAANAVGEWPKGGAIAPQKGSRQKFKYATFISYCFSEYS